VGIACTQTLDHLDGRIFGGAYGEENLELGIVLLKERPKVLFESLIHT
jgi:hypothetical protein